MRLKNLQKRKRTKDQTGTTFDDPEAKRAFVRAYRDGGLIDADGNASPPALDEDEDRGFVEAIMHAVEMDYARQYLDSMCVQPTDANLRSLLQRHPLHTCELQSSGWDNIAEMVDTIVVYPSGMGGGRRRAGR